MTAAPARTAFRTLQERPDVQNATPEAADVPEARNGQSGPPGTLDLSRQNGHAVVGTPAERNKAVDFAPHDQDAAPADHRCSICARPAAERAAIERDLADGVKYWALRLKYRVSTNDVSQHARALGLAPRAVRAPAAARGCWLCRHRPAAVIEAVTSCLEAGVATADLSRRTGIGEGTIAEHRRAAGLQVERQTPVVEPSPAAWAAIRSTLPVADLVAALDACGLRLSIHERAGLRCARAAGGPVPERIRTVVQRRSLDLLRHLKVQRAAAELRRQAALEQLQEALQEPERHAAERALWDARWPAIRETLASAESDFLDVLSFCHGAALRAAEDAQHADGATSTNDAHVNGLLSQAARILKTRWLPASILAVRAGREPWCTNEHGVRIFVGPSA